MTRLLHELVTAQAERRPDAVAIVHESTRLTYQDLDIWSNRLARVLRGVGCSKGDRICLFLPKSPWAVVSMLGAMKADCIYVPVDIASPAARVARILASSEPACVLGVAAAADLLRDVLALYGGPAPVRVGWLDEGPAVQDGLRQDFGLSDLSSCDAAPLSPESSSDAPAHLLFTSGSTGQPKGVVITHGNVLRFVEWATRYFRMGPRDRTSGHAPLHFDLSTFDIYGTFAAGAELHQVPPEVGLSPHRLSRFIRDEKLTQWFSVPSALGYMARFDAVRHGDFPSLRRLLWCGEVLPTPVLRYWMARLPHVTFTNLYGPTEATIASSYYTVPEPPGDDRAEIPIGLACDGEELLVLDDALQPVPRGEVGQLYIRGAGLSPGYWRDPEKTAEAFVWGRPPGSPADRIYRTGDLAKIGDDGLTYFIGRADTQIKSRGYRIELGEVERAASTLDGLSECAVVAIDGGGFEGAVICCAYALRPGADRTPARLRSELGRLLPAYMLPSRWLRVDALTRNQNGKIDRATLKERFQRHASEAD